MPGQTREKLNGVLVGVEQDLTKLFMTQHLLENHASVEGDFLVLVACESGEDNVWSSSDVIDGGPS